MDYIENSETPSAGWPVRQLWSSLHYGCTPAILPIMLLPATMLLFSGCNGSGSNGSSSSPQPVIWLLDNLVQIGGHQPEVHGSPAVVSNSQMGDALSFDGSSDGLIMPVNPVEGWDQFTVEVLFWPASSGPEAQRFVHFEDETRNRGLIETRVTPEGTWTLDTFLYNGETESGHTLIDHSIQHPADQWYWAALTYDGRNMKHFINGVEELAGEIEIGTMGPGKISLGVRQNLVYWYEGLMREIRFYPEALEAERLQKPD